MTVITTHLVVAADGTVSLADAIPAGRYVATVSAQPDAILPTRRFRIEDLPKHDLVPADGHWPSFSRDEIYGDDGR